MKVIFKYPFPIEDRFELVLPHEAQILKVAMHHSQACMWVLGCPQIFRETRFFYVFGTGNEVSDQKDLQYVATFFNGLFAWHLFEEKK